MRTVRSNIYKFLTKSFANRMYRHCQENSATMNEENGAGEVHGICKDQFTADAVMVQQALHKEKTTNHLFLCRIKIYNWSYETSN